MSLNGSGVFNVNTSGQPVQDGTLITAAVFNAYTADVATALSTALYKDGQQIATANQPMGGFKHTNIADATARTQYASAGQAQDGALAYLTGVSGTNTILASVNPTPSAYAAGQRFSLIVGTTNTGATTLNVSSLGAKSVKKKMSGGKVSLVAADLIANQSAEVFYDGTDFILETARTYSHGADVASASTTDLDAVTGDLIDINTVVTPINAITLTEGEERTVRFTGILTLTHGASLVLPTAANITTAAGDFAVFRGYASGVVRCVTYSPISGRQLASVTPAAVASARKVRASVTSANASATFTADALLAEVTVGGAALLLTSFSQACNLATTGAGGMDTGAAPTSGFVSVYAIAKADGTKNILACAVATSSGQVYGGANMPSGYTYSYLLAIWPTDGSSRFVPGVLLDRKLALQSAIAIFTLQTGSTTLTSQSISAGVPAAARTADLTMFSASTSQSYVWGAAGDSSGTGMSQFPVTTSGGTFTGFTGVGTIAGQTYLRDIPLITAQTIYWVELFGRVSQTNLSVVGYTI